MSSFVLYKGNEVSGIFGAVPMMSILDTVLNTQDFQMLGTAVQIVHLEKILHGTEPFTLFAPRNLAFRQLTKVT